MDLDNIDLIQIYNNFNGPYRTYNKRQHITVNSDGTYTYKNGAHEVPGFGGYTVFKKSDWEKNNGFTNLCIGWGYEDDMTKCRYNLKTYDRTFGHIWHESNNSFGTDDTNINEEAYNLDKSGKINYQLDGYKQLTYDIISDEYINTNIRQIKVKNIGVISTYTYKDILKKHKDSVIKE